MTAPATTSWTLVGPNSEKYYLVGPHSQRKVLEIVLGVFVGSALHGHHFSIQEVDHEKQMFADLLASVHELLAEYSTSLKRKTRSCKPKRTL